MLTWISYYKLSFNASLQNSKNNMNHSPLQHFAVSRPRVFTSFHNYSSEITHAKEVCAKY